MGNLLGIKMIKIEKKTFWSQEEICIKNAEIFRKNYFQHLKKCKEASVPNLCHNSELAL